jgi:hypothetical protein
MTTLAVPQTTLFALDIPLPPKESTSMAATAMLSSLNISQWSGYKYDPDASEELALSHGAEKDAARVNKRLVPRKELEEITQAVGRARRDHEFLTLPWTDDGWRVLPAGTYFEHKDKMQEHKTAVLGAVEKLVCRFEDLVRNQSRLGTLFRIEDYPGMRDENGVLRLLFPQELREKFSFATDVKPLPDANDFRVNIGDEERERLKKQIAESVQASLRASTRDLWQRLYEVVRHMATRMADYNAAENDNKPRLYKSMVTNIVEIVDVLPRLNISGDEELSRMTDTIRRSLLVDTDELRKSETLRTDTAKAAADIMQRMAAYMGLPPEGSQVAVS